MSLAAAADDRRGPFFWIARIAETNAVPRLQRNPAAGAVDCRTPVIQSTYFAGKIIN